jgi:hypothetical protein
MDPTKEQHQLLFKSRRKCDGDPGNDWTSVWVRKHEPYTENPNSPRPKEKRQVKRKAKSILSSGELFTKNSFWQDKQSVPHTAVTFCGNCVKMCKHFSPNFENKRNGCCITTTHHLTLLLHEGFFLTKTTLLPSPT